MKVNYKLVIIVIAFLFGLYFCLRYKSNDLLENFQGTSQCPNMLVKKGKELHLINTKKAMIPGVNPIKFESLEDYAEYIDWSKKVGIKCPILYYEQTFNTQGERGYRLLDDPLNPSPGLPSIIPYQRQASNQLLTDSNRDDPPYNQNNYAGFDPENQYIGVKTPLDTINLQQNSGSLSAMDSNWVGGKGTQKAIKAGRFDGRIRTPNDKFDYTYPSQQNNINISSRTESKNINTNTELSTASLSRLPRNEELLGSSLKKDIQPKFDEIKQSTEETNNYMQNKTDQTKRKIGERQMSMQPSTGVTAVTATNLALDTPPVEEDTIEQPINPESAVSTESNKAQAAANEAQDAAKAVSRRRGAEWAEIETSTIGRRRGSFPDIEQAPTEQAPRRRGERPLPGSATPTSTLKNTDAPIEQSPPEQAPIEQSPPEQAPETEPVPETAEEHQARPIGTGWRAIAEQQRRKAESERKKLLEATGRQVNEEEERKVAAAYERKAREQAEQAEQANQEKIAKAQAAANKAAQAAKKAAADKAATEKAAADKAAAEKAAAMKQQRAAEKQRKAEEIAAKAAAADKAAAEEEAARVAASDKAAAEKAAADKAAAEKAAADKAAAEKAAADKAAAEKAEAEKTSTSVTASAGFNPFDAVIAQVESIFSRPALDLWGRPILDPKNQKRGWNPFGLW
jgi:hypothetical protein